MWRPSQLCVYARHAVRALAGQHALRRFAATLPVCVYVTVKLDIRVLSLSVCACICMRADYQHMNVKLDICAGGRSTRASARSVSPL